jgi:hypothetical protein
LLALDKPLIAIGPLSYINPERLDDSYNATLFRDVIDAGWLISRLSERTEQLVAREESFTHAR